jgi:hypothetical protein
MKMLQVLRNPETDRLSLDIQGFGHWGLPITAETSEVLLSELPDHEEWCNLEFCCAVNDAIDDFLTQGN